MAYFSNGTEGESYRERYCYRCEHFPENDDSRECPIWGAHLFHAYGAKGATKDVLDMLIPMKDYTFSDGITIRVAAECTFFRHRTEALPFGG